VDANCECGEQAHALEAEAVVVVCDIRIDNRRRVVGHVSGLVREVHRRILLRTHAACSAP
jgi:hypothetical protein